MKTKTGRGHRWCFFLNLKIPLRLFSTAGLLATAVLTAEAAGYGWGGADSTDWATGANWYNGSVAPTAGTYDATLYITNSTANTLTYTEANGSTLYTSSARCLRIGDGKDGSMAITGGFLETRGTGDFVGNSLGKSGSLTIDGGTYVSTNGEFLLGANVGLGTLTVNSGSATLSSMKLWSSIGTVNLNGGTLGLSGMTWTSGSAALNLNGGTLQVSKNTPSWMLAATNWVCNLNAPTTLDSQGYFATNGATINGVGSLTKIGSGLIALNVSNTVEAITVNEGTLALGGSNTVSSGVTLNETATLCINHAAALGSSPFTINGGRIRNTSSSSVINSLNGPINIYSNFSFTGTRDLNLGTGTATFYRDLVVTNWSGTLTFGGDLTDGGSKLDLRVAGSGGMVIKGNLDIGGQLTAVGNATLRLSGANSYTGRTTVSAARLIADNPDALGTAEGPSYVMGGAAIQLMGGITVESETAYLMGSGYSDNRGSLQAASGSTNTWNGPIMLNDATAWTPRLGYLGSGVLIVNGPIVPAFSDAKNLYISGDPDPVGRVIITGTNNTYSGITGLIRGVLALGATNALPVVTAFDMRPADSVSDDATFDLNGFSQTLGSFKGTHSFANLYLTNGAETASVLTLNQTAATTYDGRIDGNLSLVLDNSGSLTLTGAGNTWTGSTTLNDGTLVLGTDGALSPNTSLVIGNATLDAGAWANAAQQLTVSGAATIDIGDGTGSLQFADSSSQTWSGTLNLVGTFSESAIRFGSSAGGLTQAQLSLIRINGQYKWLALNADGHLYIRTGMLIRVH